MDGQGYRRRRGDGGLLHLAAIDLYSTREGFGKRYGFVYIDADNGFKRIKKDSFAWYKKVIASNGADLADVEA